MGDEPNTLGDRRRSRRREPERLDNPALVICSQLPRLASGDPAGDRIGTPAGGPERQIVFDCV